MVELPHKFEDEQLLADALDLSSDEHARLEWLGDRTLGFIIANELFKSHRQRGAGELTRALANYVNNRHLSVLSERMGLVDGDIGDVFGISSANVVEAYIGAVFLDGGLDAARKAVFEIYGESLSVPDDGVWLKDPKTMLKEHCDKNKVVKPMYSLADSDGKDSYCVLCQAMGMEEKGFGSSKNEAEIMAATAMLERLGIDHTQENGQ